MIGIGLASNFLFFFSCLQPNLKDSETISLSALNINEDDYLEDSTMDNSFASSHLIQNLQQGDWK